MTRTTTGARGARITRRLRGVAAAALTALLAGAAGASAGRFAETAGRRTSSTTTPMPSGRPAMVTILGRPPASVGVGVGDARRGERADRDVRPSTTPRSSPRRSAARSVPAAGGSGPEPCSRTAYRTTRASRPSITRVERAPTRPAVAAALLVDERTG